MSNQKGDWEVFFRMAGILGALATFVWGVWTYQDTSAQRLRQEKAMADRHAETRRIEATRPFLDRQLTLYTEAAQVASTLATSSDRSEVEKATQRFWKLYWGELALVEDKQIEAVMFRFGECIREDCSTGQLQQASLRLAHACRDSLAESWGVSEWQSPHGR